MVGPTTTAISSVAVPIQAAKGKIANPDVMNIVSFSPFEKVSSKGDWNKQQEYSKNHVISNRYIRGFSQHFW